jgi:anti-sigma factor RsiW
MMMMTCRQITESATDWLEGALPVRQRLAFRLHLWACHHCRRFLRQLKWTTAALRALPAQSAPEPMKQALMARFRALPRTAEAPRPAPRPSVLERLLGMGRGGWMFGAVLLTLVVTAILRAQPGAAFGPRLCLGVILMAGVAPMAVVAAESLASRRRYSYGVFLGPAGLGALGGHLAAFYGGCTTGETLPHLLFFHLGAALLVGLLGLSTARWLPARA